MRRLVLGMAAGLGLMAAAGDAAADWHKAETENFIVYSDTSRGQIQDYARKIERFHEVMRTVLPVPTDTIPAKLEIYVIDGTSDMRQISPGIGAGIGGFYSASENRIFAVVDQSRSEGDKTLFHEYVHHYMLQYAPGAYPGWFIEGFAEYYATADMDNTRTRIGLFSPGRMNSLIQTNAWVPMEDLLLSRSSALSRGQGPTYYAQAWALTSYLLSTPERQKTLSAYLAAIADGRDPVQALVGTLDRTPAQLQDDVRRYLYRGLPLKIIAAPEAPAEVTVTRLPDSADDLMLFELRLSRGVSDEDAPGVLTRARAAAARYPGDRLAGLVLAVAEAENKNLDQAEAALKPLIEADPADAQALRLMGEVMLARAALDDTDEAGATRIRNEALRVLARSLDADAFDFRTYLALDETRRGAANYPTDNDLQLLRDAADLAPQVSSVRYRTAQGLMAREAYGEVIALLLPVANNPHGGDGLKSVRDLLAQAREKAGLAAVPDAPPPPSADAPGAETTGDEGAEPTSPS